MIAEIAKNQRVGFFRIRESILGAFTKSASRCEIGQRVRRGYVQMALQRHVSSEAANVLALDALFLTVFIDPDFDIGRIVV